MSRPRAAISWSGGKDSCAALQRSVETFDVVSMITMVDETGERSRSHGLRPSLLAAQAERLGVTRVAARCSWNTYDAAFSAALRDIRRDGVTHVIFGDIMFDEHRAWAERVCERAGLVAVEPLWGMPTRETAHAFVASGATAIIVTTRAHLLDASWLGRPLTAGVLDDLERMGVDPCGERGEYHTLVVDSPLFNRPLRVVPRGHVLRSGCYALDLDLAESEHPVAARD